MVRNIRRMFMEETLAWKLVWTLAFPALAIVRDDSNDSLILEQHAYKILEDAFQRRKSDALPCNRRDDENWRNSRGYGEITEQTVFEVLQRVRRHKSSKATWCIVDLGSGSGRVLQAAIVGCLPVVELIGLELQPQLHQQALERAQIWDSFTVEKKNKN